MNRNELKEKLLQMNYGDVYTFEILNKNDSCVWATFITKTRWFDSHCYVIGGSGDNLKVSEDIDIEDAEEVLNKFIDNYIDELFIDEKFNSFKLYDKSELKIISNTPSFKHKTYDNFSYI